MMWGGLVEIVIGLVAPTGVRQGQARSLVADESGIRLSRARRESCAVPRSRIHGIRIVEGDAGFRNGVLIDAEGEVGGVVLTPLSPDGGAYTPQESWRLVSALEDEGRRASQYRPRE